jgi:hypothetical protein
MLVFEVSLIPQGGGRWAALLDGAVLSTEITRPGPEIAAILLANGADPRAILTIRAGAAVIASDPLGWASGKPVMCADVDVVEKD